jgi:hypothetical protein
MSYKPPMFRANEDGWTTVQPKLTRADFDSKPGVPEQKGKYKPPAQRGPEKKPEANTFDEAFPELGPSKAQPPSSPQTPPPTTNTETKKPLKSLADLFKPSQPTIKTTQNVPVARTLDDVVKMRESTPKTTKIVWELSKVAQTSQDPDWVAVRTKIYDYMRIYGDDIIRHDQMRVLEITDEEMEARCGPDLPSYPPGLWQKLKDLRDRQAKLQKQREKMNDRTLFGPSSDDELPEEIEEESFEDYDSRSGEESTELEAHDDDF